MPGPTEIIVQDAPVTDANATVFDAIDAANGNYFANDGDCIVIFQNDGTEQIATIATQASYGGFALADMTVTIPATTGFAVLPPLDPGIFNDSSGHVQITYNGAGGVDIAVVRRLH